MMPIAAPPPHCDKSSRKSVFLRFIRRLERYPSLRHSFKKHIIPVLPVSTTHLRTNICGFEICLDSTDEVDYGYAAGVIDTEELDFLLAHRKRMAAFVDIGANIGFYSLFIACHCPEIQVISFEPDPFIYEKLQRNININNYSNITACRYAVAPDNQPRELMIFTNRNRGGSSLIITQTTYAMEKSITVPCLSLVEIVQQNQIGPAWGAKIDVEGYEYPILETFFSIAPPEIWPELAVVECFGHMIKKTGGSAIQLLCEKGYLLIEHTSRHNYMFLRKKM